MGKLNKYPKVIMILAVLAIVLIIGFHSTSHADQISMTFTGVNGQIDHGYYIDPYAATVNGVTNTTIWCVDFNHEVHFGDTWTANVTPVTVPNSDTYLNNTTKYSEMAWLISQYPIQDSANKAAMQWVIWDISLDNQIHSGNSTLYGHWHDLAVNPDNYNSVDYTGWVILSDVNRNKQEFIVTHPVPEPSTLLLLGSGLLVLGVLSRRRLKTRR